MSSQKEVPTHDCLPGGLFRKSVWGTGGQSSLGPPRKRSNRRDAEDARELLWKGGFLCDLCASAMNLAETKIKPGVLEHKRKVHQLVRECPVSSHRKCPGLSFSPKPPRPLPKQPLQLQPSLLHYIYGSCCEDLSLPWGTSLFSPMSWPWFL